jgi:Bacterial SH3 domain/Chaperone of endosialidase
MKPTPQRTEDTIMRILTVLILLPVAAFADIVVPADRVENSVNVRLSPDASSEIVGKLDKGASAELVESIDGWHEIQLEGGATGFISADWSQVVSDTEDDVVAIVEEVVEEVVEDALEATVESAVDDTVDAITNTDIADAVSEDAVEEQATVPAVVAEAEVESVPVPKLDPVTEPDAKPAPSVQTTIVEAHDPGDALAELKGTRNFLVKFRDESEGGDSQIYDNGNRVGIGTTEPKQRLEVNGSIQIHEQHSSVAGLMITQSSGDTGYIMHNRASTLTIGAGSQDRITIDRDGNVGLAVARPDHPLEMASGAHVTAGGVWTNSSSREQKENIEELSAEAATETLMALDPVVFNYRAEQGEDYVGFIAEDVPALVANRDRDALSAMDIVAVLTRVVQEQQNKIRELEKKLEAM